MYYCEVKHNYMMVRLSHLYIEEEQDWIQSHKSMTRK